MAEVEDDDDDQMGREKRDVNPLFLKLGLALAVSIGGLLFNFIRNKRIKPSKSPSDSSDSSDCNNQGISPNKCKFDPLATDKQDDLHKSMLDKDTYLLPEFNDLVKEFDISSMETNADLPFSDTESSLKVYPSVVKDSHEQEINSLRNMVKTLKERERNLETQLLEYYGLKEQQTTIMELQNRLKLNNMEAKLFRLKIESLQTENKILESQMADYTKVVADLEAARAKIKVLKRKLRSETAKNKEQIINLQQRVEKMQDEHTGCVGIDPEIQLKLCKLKDLEAEAEELKKSNYCLQVEKSELGQKLENVQILATSVLEDEEKEKLKEESEKLKKQNEDLTKEIEQLQTDRCGDIEELVYLKWINACLRYELRNHQPDPGKTMARDLSKTLSPKSEQKAKQLILEYANKEDICEKGLIIPELDFDQWSTSQASNLTDSGELDESSIDYSSPRKTNNKFFGKLVKFLRGKDNYTPAHHHHHHHHDRRQYSHSRNSSLEDSNLFSDSSFRELGNSSKHSMDSQRSIHRHSDLGIHRRIDSIAEDGSIGGLVSPSSDGQKSELVKYAKVLKDSNSMPNMKFRQRSTSFS